MEFPERILEDMFPPDVHSQILPPEPIIRPLKLRPEVLPLDIEVEEPRVVHQHAEGSVGEVNGGLTQNLIQHGPVRF